MHWASSRQRRGERRWLLGDLSPGWMSSPGQWTSNSAQHPPPKSTRNLVSVQPLNGKGSLPGVESPRDRR